MQTNRARKAIGKNLPGTVLSFLWLAESQVPKDRRRGSQLRSETAVGLREQDSDRRYMTFRRTFVI
jgi:hypothetical protein